MHNLKKITALSLLCFSSLAMAQSTTCLRIENIEGQDATSTNDYQMEDSLIVGEILFCYRGEQGKFSNNEGTFTRFGSNTWIWFNAIEETEVAEVWTFDFTNRKALLARTRGPGALFPPIVGAYVGDITGVTSE